MLILQGEMIDRIETNIENAADWIQEGAQVVQHCVNIANQRVIANSCYGHNVSFCRHLLQLIF